MLVMGAGRGRVGEEVADVVAVDEEGAPVDERGGGVDEGGGGVVVKEEGVPPHHLQLHRRRRVGEGEIGDLGRVGAMGVRVRDSTHTYKFAAPLLLYFFFFFRGKKCFFIFFPPIFNDFDFFSLALGLGLVFSDGRKFKILAGKKGKFTWT